MAVACSVPWRDRSVGFVGVSDGWQDLSRHKRMTWHCHRAENGNVALAGEVDLRAVGGDGFTVAIAFGRNTAEAGQRARASLLQGFEPAHRRYVSEWQEWQKHLKLPVENREGSRDLFLTSAAVMRIHEAKRFPGGVIASLSVPWGFSKGDNDLGGYHLVWPRDLVETAGGLLAVGALRDARQVLDYLRVTQETDGHWAQNMWLDGAPYWEGIQMDEAAFPILLVDLARREGALGDESVAEFWPLVHRAAGYIVQNGPVTQQDRWEEDQGYSPFTLAVEIAALLAAADMADDWGETAMALYLRECADVWNANIERWTYVTDTELARQAGARGYYVRIAPPDTADASSPSGGFVPIKNRPPGQALEAADHIVSPDALALVRFGLRAPDDPRILDTLKVIDALLRVETPRGPAWRRYNDDGYGEHEDGTPFDGTGKGRAWPLLTGERGHYELAAGKIDEAEKMLASLAAFAGNGEMLPEQVWDDRDIPRRELFCGRPSGSAMPLVWAHAEYVKLCRSIQERRVFDQPPQTVKRYIEGHRVCRHHIWRFNHKCRMMPAGQILRIETLAPATVVWSADGWKNERKTTTTSTGLGVHVADLPTRDLDAGTEIEFTFYWDDVSHWEGMNFFVHILDADGGG